MTLTREQKISRAVTRYNNRVDRELPLLAPVLKTDHAQQSARYEVIEAALDEYKARLDAFDLEMKTRGEAYRVVASRLYTQDEMAAFDERYEKVFGNLGFEYFCDYWHKICLKAGVEI